MLRLGVDARELLNRPAGKGQYLRKLLEAWLQASPVELGGTLSLTLYVKHGQAGSENLRDTLMALRAEHSAVGELAVVALSGSGLLWHRAVARSLKRDNVAVFFAALSYFSAVWNKVPTLSVVHDLAVFKVAGLAHNRRAMLVERVMLRRMVQKSAAIIAVSAATKADLLELAPSAGPKLQVLGEGPVSVRPDQPVLARAKRQPVILSLGTLEPRKNIGLLLRGYAALSSDLQAAYRLVVIGKPGWGNEDYPAMAKALGIADHVDFLGYQDDAAVSEALRSASLFVYPSLYEGFGLPPLDAMLAGTPVIVSTTPALAELVGSAGVQVDPQDERALAAAITTLLTDAAACERAAQAGRAQAGAHRWEDVATNIYKLASSVSHHA